MDAKKNDARRELSLDDSQRFDKANLADDEQRTPSQILMSQEEWMEYLRKQPLVYRRILILLREGKSQAEIAQELKISVRLVQRVVERFLAREST